MSVKLNVDFVADEAIRRAESDPEAAAEAMLIAARYIRDQKPLPDGLREWIANALGDAALKPAINRIDALAIGLCLKVMNCPPLGDWLLIGAEFEGLVVDGMSANKAKEVIAGRYGFSTDTAERYRAKYLRAKKFHDSIE